MSLNNKTIVERQEELYLNWVTANKDSLMSKFEKAKYSLGEFNAFCRESYRKYELMMQIVSGSHA